MTKFVQCLKCKGKNGKNPTAIGYISTWVTTPNGAKIEQLVECECHKQWASRVKLESSAKRANLNPKFIDYNPDKDYLGALSRDEVSRIQNYIRRSFDASEPEEIKNALASSVLYLYGSNGTQKTTIANYMGYEFLRGGKTVYYCLMSDILKMLIASKKDPEMSDRLEKILNKDLLIIDESFDSEKASFFEDDIPLLDPFLRRRIQTLNKGIVFISNIHIDNINSTTYTTRYGQNRKSLFCNCVSIRDLVQRNVRMCKGFLEFKDNYVDLFDKNSLNNAIEELF